MHMHFTLSHYLLVLLFFYKQKDSDGVILLFTRVIFILIPLNKFSEDNTPLYKEYYILYILNKPWKLSIASSCIVFVSCDVFVSYC